MYGIYFYEDGGWHLLEGETFATEEQADTAIGEYRWAHGNIRFQVLPVTE